MDEQTSRKSESLESRYGIGLNPPAHALGEEPLSRGDRLIWECLRDAHQELVFGYGDQALGVLTLADDTRLTEPTGAAMRYWYWRGLACCQMGRDAIGQESIGDFEQAADAMRRAAQLAREIDDLPSHINILRMVAEAEFGMMRHDAALNTFQSVLSTLLDHPADDAKRQARAEIFLRSRLARLQFLLSQFASAVENIERARQLRRHFAGPVMSNKDRATEEWIEALIYRYQSDCCGADLPRLQQAMRLLRSAQQRLLADPQSAMNQLRVLIQITETHLDLADYYRRTDDLPAFRYNMKRAETFGFQSAQALKGSSDESGLALATLANLRHQLLSYGPMEAAALSAAIRSHTSDGGAVRLRVILPALFHILKVARKDGDHVLVARALTLWAEYLSAAHADAAALQTYYRALDIFARAGAPGESGRTKIGVRRMLELA